MKILFLGTSCAEPVADIGFTSFLISAERSLILVDASGNPVQSILKAGVDPAALDLVALTHYHADHIAGYPSLVQTLGCLGRDKELVVVCGEATLQKVLGLHALLELDPPNTPFPVRFKDNFSAADLQIQLFPGNHSVPSSMVRVRYKDRGLLYTSDTAFTPQVAEAARGCATLIHEATFSHTRIGDPGHKGHSSAYQAGLAAADAGVERLILCHICWHKYSSARAIPEEAGSVFHGEIIVPELFTWYAV